MKIEFLKNEDSFPGRFRLLLFSLLILAGAGLYSCANPVAPTGGPVDEQPPQVVRSTPDNYSTNFQGGQVRIFFDEFVQLKDINSKLLISPPLETTPEIRLRGRSLIMEIDEELRPNTTYNFFFGDAIVDITEGNPMLNFQFIVSTGDFVDSLSVKGQVLHAYTLAPMEEQTYVMLYDEHYDSIPYKEKPVYLSKTNAEGGFIIHNMREGKFKIFALQDLNANFLYDLPDERIAFLDSLIIPQDLQWEEMESRPDTASQEPGEGQTLDIQPPDLPGFTPQPDTLLPAAPDVEPVDTLIGFPQQGHFYSLFMFQEPDTVQRVISSTTVRQGLIQVVFRVPTDSVWVQEIRDPFDREWYISDLGKNKDTLRLWLPDVVRDSLFLQIGDGSMIVDTLALATTPRRAPQETDQKLTLRLNTQPGGALPYFQPLEIIAGRPLSKYDLSKVQLVKDDSLMLEARLVFADSVRRVVRLDTLLAPEESFQLTLLPGAFTDIFGLTNDTLQRRFQTTLPENYGTLLLTLELPHQENLFILQLLDPNDQVVEKKVVSQSGMVTFQHLLPGEYRLRLISDRNENGKWDPGHYLRAIQPESVYIFQEPLQLRANWEMEVPWSPRPLQ